MRIIPQTPPYSYSLEQIEIGQEVRFDLLVEEQDVTTFANLSGDFSDLHMNDEFARRSRFRGKVVHGMLPLTAVSTLVGMHLPGRQAILLGMEVSFLAPVRIGDRLFVEGKVIAKSASTRIIKLQVLIHQFLTGQWVTEARVEIFVSPLPRKGVTMAELSSLDLDLDFTGKTVLITGASRGIGEATAKLFAHKGANVCVNYHQGKQDAEAIVHEITQAGHRAAAFQADVTVRKEVEAMVEAALATFGRIDVLVNNAVRDATPVKFEQLTWETMRQDIDVTLQGAFHCCQAVLPHMLKQGGGAIVNLSTIFTEFPRPHLASYITAKSGLVGLTRALAVEYADRDIRVNLVTPSTTATDLTNTLSDQSFKRMAQEAPMKRNCRPIDVAKAILILTSPYTQYTTGQQMWVTGGIQLHPEG